MIALPAALTACGTGGSGGGSAPTAVPTLKSGAAVSGKVVFWHAYSAGGGEVTTLEKTLIPAFQKLHPGTTVTAVQVPSADMHQKLVTGVAGGGLPDVIRADILTVPELAKLGVLTPLDQAMPDFQTYSKKMYPGPLAANKYYEMMRWWVARGVDGFRMDVINFISKDTALPDGPVIRGRWGDGHPFYVSGPRIHEYLADMHRKALAGRHLVTVGEMPGGTVEQARLFTDPTRTEVDMVFTFEHVSLDIGANEWEVHPLRLTDLKANLASWQLGLAQVGWNSLYWNNHDQPRAVSRFGNDGEHRVTSAKTLGTILHLHRGTPYICQGEELGMTNAGFTAIEQYRDVEAIGLYAEAGAHAVDSAVILAALASHARTPMQWTSGDNAGFTTGPPWLPVTLNYDTINADAAMADPDSVFHHYRKLIDLRHTDRTVAYGDYQPVLLDHEQLFAFTRNLEADTLLVLGSFTDQHLTIELPEQAWVDTAELVLGSHSQKAATPAAGTLTLRPWESRIYRKR